MTEILYLDEPQNTEELLKSLCGPVRLWFKEKFPDFTRPQKLAIPSIMSGEHLLLCSPTGSGKTLTAFLTIIDRLIRLAMDNKLEDRVYCTYISPIKALANDIQKDSKIKLGLRDRGVKQAGFMVLYRATMPAVLVELGFLSNKLTCLVKIK